MSGVSNGLQKTTDHHADKQLFDELQHALDICDFSADENKVRIPFSASVTFTV